MSCFADYLDTYHGMCESHWKPIVSADLAALGSTSRAEPKSLVVLYRRLKTAAPNARVVVLGYPRLFPQTPTINNCSTGAPFTKFTTKAQNWLNDEATALDGVVQHAAVLAGVTYVDTYSALDGHELCQNTASTWVVRAVPSDQQESFHPNSDGQLAMEARLLTALAG